MFTVSRRDNNYREFDASITEAIRSKNESLRHSTIVAHVRGHVLRGIPAALLET